MRGAGLVLVKGTRSGLGDRVRAVLVGALYARASGRALCVDWRDGLLAEAGRDPFPQLFELHGVAAAPFPSAQARALPPAWNGRIHRSLHEVYVEDGAPPWNRAKAIARYSFDLSRLDHDAPVLVMFEFDRLDRLRARLPAELQNLDHESLLHAAWQRHLRYGERVRDGVQRWLAGDDVPRIGIHVRAAAEAMVQKGNIPLGHYFQAADQLLARTPAAAIVLATDSRDVQAAFRDRYPRVEVRPKWFPAAGDAIHLAGHDPDRFRSTHAAAVELAALARCGQLITRRNSSFSMLARITSNASAGHRITLDARRRFALRDLGPRVSHRTRALLRRLRSLLRRHANGS